MDHDCYECLTGKMGDASSVGACETLTGNATAGPAAGTPRSRLCSEALDCFRQTKCHANSVTECYCGTAIDQGACYTTKTEASGLCKKELERALQIRPGSPGMDVLNIITEATTAGGTAGIIATFENTQCAGACIPYQATAPCR